MSEANPDMRPLPERVIVDALNLAYWGGRPADLRLPLSAATLLLESGVATVLYFDASAPHRLEDAREIYEQLRQASPLIQQARSGVRADGEILRQARKTGSHVVSRDRFRDYRARFRKLVDDPARVISGHLAHEALHLPSLGLAIALPITLDAAAARFIAASHPVATQPGGRLPAMSETH